MMRLLEKVAIVKSKIRRARKFLASSKPECKTFVHFMMRPFRTVILSAAKNLTPRPFAALRVTILVYQFYAVWFSGLYAPPVPTEAFQSFHTVGYTPQTF